MGYISRSKNRISIEGDYGDSNLHYLLATIHKAIKEFEYQDLILDFGKCNAAYPSSMLATCAQVMSKRISGIDFNRIAKISGACPRAG